jgi:hypothetical protein
MNRPIRQGEVMLLPVQAMPKGDAARYDSFVVGHSETGHHHVLESDTQFEVMNDDKKHTLYVHLFEPAALVHQKRIEAHETLTVQSGIYQVLHKTEWDPWSQLTKIVFD